MRLTRVVAAVDFSEAAEASVQWAAQRLAPLDEITLVHAASTPVAPAFMTQSWSPVVEPVEGCHDHDEQRLRDLAGTLHGAKVSTVVRDGAPAHVVCDVAREREADLIVVGPHGDTHRASRWFGTTADRIVRASTIPVLVGSTSAGLPRRILAAVDDSDMTPTVLGWAKLLADRWDAELLVLHVLTNAVFSHMLSMAAATARDRDEARDDVARELHAEAVRWLRSAVEQGCKLDRVDADVAHGDAGVEIARAGRRWEADVIVMGRHGSGRAIAPGLGGTVRRVLHEWTRPVLVATPPLDEIA